MSGSIIRSRKKSKSFWNQMKMNSQQSKTYRTNTVKAVLRGKFIVIQAYLKIIETAQIDHITKHLQEL